MNKTPSIVVIGSLNIDIVVEADRPPQMGETVSGSQVHFIPGGKGSNQAVAAARLGARTAMIGAVGGDPFGAELLQSLRREGIETSAVKTVSGTHTGVASILLSQGDNQIIVVAGANGHCTPADIDRHLERIGQADAVLLQLEIPLETVQYAAQTAKRLGKAVVLNPAPARPLPDDLLRHVDVMIPNETELYLLAEADERTELADAMRRLQDKGVRTIVTTLGAQGAAYLMEDGTFGRVAGHKVDVVDTTGAGDAFNAGFAYAMATGETVPAAVAFAVKVGALAVTRLGAHAGMPTLAQVREFAAE